MRVGLRPAVIVLGLTASIALTGCSGRTWNWKFWQSGSPSDHSVSTSAVPTAAPAESASSSGGTVATAPPMSAAEAASPRGPEGIGFARRPEFIDVHFGAGRVTLVRADAKALDAVVRWLKEHPAALVMLEGHTDDLGSRDGNLMVGEKRAASIMKYLISKGIDRERISLTSYGSDRPLCTDKTDACRAKNRRVRFLVSQP
ncbi:MAG: OmpA family protein [Candidatus Rokuibacteriota bacterium]